MGTNCTQGREVLPFTPSLTFVSLPQTQWHAPVNIDHMARQRVCVWVWVCACAHVCPWICKSCPLSLETDSGSVIKVTDTGLNPFPGNTDHSTPQWLHVKTKCVFVRGWTGKNGKSPIIAVVICVHVCALIVSIKLSSSGFHWLRCSFFIISTSSVVVQDT